MDKENQVTTKMSIFSTPYYQGLGNNFPTACEAEPYFNFSAYQLFCLKTRLTPRIITLLGSGIQVRVLRVRTNQRMNLTVQLFKITDSVYDQAVTVSEEQFRLIQQWIDEIMGFRPEYCLIATTGLNAAVSTELISTQWIRSMLPYLAVNITSEDPDYLYNDNPDQFLPFVTEEGIFVCLDMPMKTDQFLVIQDKRDYATLYQRVLQNILDQLRNLYLQGAMVLGPNSPLVSVWHLEPFDWLSKDESGYRVFTAPWTDNRFAEDKVSFMTSRLLGSNTISINTPENWVSRHYITKNLWLYKLVTAIEAVKFDGLEVQVPAEDLDTAQTIASTVVASASLATGKVVVINASRLSWLYLYREAAQKVLGDQANTAFYMVNNPLRPYVFSLLVDTSRLPVEIRKQIKTATYQRLNELTASKEVSSVHDWIERNYS